MKEELLSTGELAKRMNVTVRTLQYYDREGLLSPSSFSEGGRRLYSTKDIVKLHQILSFKYLGFSLEEIKARIFSLDTPEQVTEVLDQQYQTIQEQIETLQEALEAIAALRNEVREMDQVDFGKYADIIELLRQGNKNYWVWKLFDSEVTEHIKKRFQENPDLAEEINETYPRLLKKAVSLVRKKESPESKESLALAEEWWKMVQDFTGGDMSLLPKLEKFNQSKAGWKTEIAQLQQEADNYLGQILMYYFRKIEIERPEKE